MFVSKNKKDAYVGVKKDQLFKFPRHELNKEKHIIDNNPLF